MPICPTCWSCSLLEPLPPVHRGHCHQRQGSSQASTRLCLKLPQRTWFLESGSLVSGVKKIELGPSPQHKVQAQWAGPSPLPLSSSPPAPATLPHSSHHAPHLQGSPQPSQSSKLLFILQSPGEVSLLLGYLPSAQSALIVIPFTGF